MLYDRNRDTFIIDIWRFVLKIFFEFFVLYLKTIVLEIWINKKKTRIIWQKSHIKDPDNPFWQRTESFSNYKLEILKALPKRDSIFYARIIPLHLHGEKNPRNLEDVIKNANPLCETIFVNNFLRDFSEGHQQNQIIVPILYICMNVSTLRSVRLIFRLFVSFSLYIFGRFSIFMFRSRKRALLRYRVFPSAFPTPTENSSQHDAIRLRTLHEFLTIQPETKFYSLENVKIFSSDVQTHCFRGRKRFSASASHDF